METCGLFVVGAGPGDPELITIKALNVIKRADVILFDNLVNKVLLEFAPINCTTIYVGKKPYGEYTKQEEIHQLILKYALPKKVVVRLKGGDPFIFGRGFEEICFAAQHNIPTHYVPGITSMQAAGLYNIPITHRDAGDSVWIVTGTKKDGTLSKDLKQAMKSSATVVIYMGMKNISEISQAYSDEGLAERPAAIIYCASLPQAKMVVCRVKDLEREADKAKLTHPSIIIIGSVVAMYHKLDLEKIDLPETNRKD